jgi:hypothetical protein
MVKLTPTSLSDVGTLTQLASTLKVDIKALHLVRISPSLCRSLSCNLPSCEGNHGYCILCSQTWFPTSESRTRGHGLHGPEYMREYNGVVQRKACCCDIPLCEKIGYSHSGMFRLPADSTQRAVWARKFIRTALTTIATTPAPPSSQPQPIATPLPSSTARTTNTSTAKAPISGLKAQRLNFTASAPRARTKRNSPEAQQIQELEDAACLIQLQLNEKVGELNACLEAQKQLQLTVEAMGSEMIQIKIENAKLKGEIASLTSRIEELEKNKSLLSYDDLKEGGMLADYVGQFTFFPTYKCNDNFLYWLNWTDRCYPGDGLCERMTRYHHVSVDKIKQYQQECIR